MFQDERAVHIATTRGTQTLSVLIFRLGTLWFALPTTVCKEVTEMRRLHTLPHRPGRTQLGLVNIRGELHLYLSLSQLLGLEQRDDTDESPSHQRHARLVVTEYEAERWVFRVDAIHGIEDSSICAIQEGVTAVTPSLGAMLGGSIAWHETQVLYLDPKHLLAALRRELV